MPTGVKHLWFPQRWPYRLRLRSIRQCSGRKLDWVRQRNATMPWVYKIIPSHQEFSFLLLFFFLTKCYRTMQQSSPCPSMAAPPFIPTDGLTGLVTLKLVLGARVGVPMLQQLQFWQQTAAPSQKLIIMLTCKEKHFLVLGFGLELTLLTQLMLGLTLQFGLV